MATTVHIPDELLAEVDERAKSLKLSRNRFIVGALKNALAEERPWSPGFKEALASFSQLDEEHDLAKLVLKHRRSRKTSPF